MNNEMIHFPNVNPKIHNMNSQHKMSTLYYKTLKSIGGKTALYIMLEILKTRTHR